MMFCYNFILYLTAGFAKSGTTDFSARIQIHPLVYTGVSKELYWWNQYRFIINSTLSDYSDLLDKAVTNILQHPSSDNENIIKPYYPAIVGELTTITMNDVAYWREDPRNKGLQEPKYLTPHDVHGLNNDVKLIVLMRNPVSRLYSHYNMFRSKFNPSPDDFHTRVINSIQWWEKCLKILPLRGCLYGSPPEMPEVEHTISSWWKTEHNYTGTIRDGLYYFFLKDWLNVFPQKNILLIKSEEYNDNKLSIINNQVFPFLGIPTAEGVVAHQIQQMPNIFGRKYLPMLQTTKDVLNKFYGTYNKMLANLLGDTKWIWKA